MSLCVSGILYMLKHYPYCSHFQRDLTQSCSIAKYTGSQFYNILHILVLIGYTVQKLENPPLLSPFFH